MLTENIERFSSHMISRRRVHHFIDAYIRRPCGPFFCSPSAALGHDLTLRG
jgi:hypothetical protein